jgi:cell division transport system permease protein
VKLLRFREAGRAALANIWQSKTRHLVSLAVIALAFLTVGIFLALANHLRGRAAELGQDAAVVFYLRSDLPPLEQDLIARQVGSAPLVASARIVPAEEARSRFLEEFPDLGGIVASLGRNPFPASVEATLRNPATPAEVVLAFIDEVRRAPGVEDAVFNREAADRVRALGRLAEAVGLGFGGLLVAASIVIISGLVKLNVVARRDEIEILRLVGASNAYIRGPYLLEGLLLGIAGSVAAVALTALAGRLFPALLGEALGPLGELIALRPLTLLQGSSLIAAGGAAGFAGSAASLARFLKI